MKLKGAVTAAALVGASVALVWADQGNPQPAGQPSKPVIRVEESRIDLGTVKAGDSAVAVFVLHNDGDVPVKILKAKPS